MMDVACRFAEALRAIAAQHDPTDIDVIWRETRVERLGWDALRLARQDHDAGWEAVLEEIDGLLLGLLERLPPLARVDTPAARRLATFRLPALERLQHATAAALVAHRFGTAGLTTVVGDQEAPLARRYYAFLTLAARHPTAQWPLFARYLSPLAHHAFLGTAVEAARYYPEQGAARALVLLFDAVRADLHLRAFLSPKILESLFVLNDPATLPFFRDLLVTGHTASDPEVCEVTRALVMVRRLTGQVEPNAKFPDVDDESIHAVLDNAESVFDRERDRLSRVAVI